MQINEKNVRFILQFIKDDAVRNPFLLLQILLLLMFGVSEACVSLSLFLIWFGNTFLLIFLAVQKMT